MAENQPNGQAANQPQLSVQKIYIKDASFEVPNAPLRVPDPGQPQVQLNLAQQATAPTQAQDVFELELTVTVTCKIGDKTAHLAEVKQAGIFGVAGFDEAARDAVLGSYCPNVLFPYARRPSPTWCRAAVSRPSCCSRSTSTRCTPKPPAAARLETRRHSGAERLIAAAARMSDRPQRPPGPRRRTRRGLLGHGSPPPRWRATRTPSPRCGGVMRPPSTRWRSHRNARYLPETELPAALRFSADLEACVRAADLVLVVVPSHAFGALIAAIAPGCGRAPDWPGAAKGFEPGSGLPASKWWHNTCRRRPPPSSPARPSRGGGGRLPTTAVTVHSDDVAFAQRVARLLHGPTFRAYRHRHARRGAGRRHEERAGRGHQRGRRHAARTERPRRAHHARPQRDAAPGRGHRRRPKP